MPHKRVPYTRPEGKREARLIIIATEGRKTEPIYFGALKEKYLSSGVHVEIIDRKTNSSNPERVMEALDEFADKYEIAYDDELWMVVDRDYQSWGEKELSYVAQQCHRKKGYHLGLSNPAFEIWLLLHLVDIDEFSSEEKKRFYENRKVSAHKTLLKQEVSNHMPNGFRESDYDAEYLIQYVNQAIRQAKSLDKNPRERWPNQVGTRVYRLAEKIKKGK
ncbi:MAG: RloB family protein [Bacteroidota bacterium]